MRCILLKQLTMWFTYWGFYHPYFTLLRSAIHTYTLALKQISVNKYLNSKLNHFPQTLFLLQPHDNINNNEFIIILLVLDSVFLVVRSKDACCFNNLLLLLLYRECIERLGVMRTFCT